MSQKVKGFWLKNLLKGKVWIMGAIVLMLNVACGGGGGGEVATPTPVGSSTPSTPPATPPATPPPVAGIKVPKELDVVRVK